MMSENLIIAYIEAGAQIVSVLLGAIAAAFIGKRFID